MSFKRKDRRGRAKQLKSRPQLSASPSTTLEEPQRQLIKESPKEFENSQEIPSVPAEVPPTAAREAAKWQMQLAYGTVYSKGDVQLLGSAFLDAFRLCQSPADEIDYENRNLVLFDYPSAIVPGPLELRSTPRGRFYVLDVHKRRVRVREHVAVMSVPMVQEFYEYFMSVDALRPSGSRLTYGEYDKETLAEIREWNNDFYAALKTTTDPNDTFALMMENMTVMPVKDFLPKTDPAPALPATAPAYDGCRVA